MGKEKETHAYRIEIIGMPGVCYPKEAFNYAFHMTGTLAEIMAEIDSYTSRGHAVKVEKEG